MEEVLRIVKYHVNWGYYIYTAKDINNLKKQRGVQNA